MSDATDTGPDALLAPVSRYYGQKLREFGPTAGGVDWNSVESQQRRFSELLRIAETASEFSLIDYGCGYGALLDYLRDQRRHVRYMGYDIAPDMITCAADRHAGSEDAVFACQPPAGAADYVVASGIFNVKLHHAPDQWAAYVLNTIDAFDALSTRGFAFNLLTTYSDPGRRREHLFYAEPAEIFAHCKRKFGRVALLHDYPLFEFTVLVRKEQ